MGAQPERLMDAAEVWGARWEACDNPMVRQYMEVVCRKETLVILAADLRTMEGLSELVDSVGPYIAALKTHVDLVDDWTVSGWATLCAQAKDHDLLIFEDRKFADIGPISRGQMAGVYDIRSWANVVTAHGISGPDIVDGLCAAWNDVDREGGVLLLAQMSSRGNLLGLDGYTDAMVAAGIANPGVFGFIGNGSRPAELSVLREKIGGKKLIWTPGVNLAVGDGEMGQRYGSPNDAIHAGSDGVIVGSGIYKSETPGDVAKAYAKICWDALLERSGV